MTDDSDDLIDCPAQAYAIAREVCRAKRCRRCPENTDQLFLFGSPKQIQAKVAWKPKGTVH